MKKNIFILLILVGNSILFSQPVILVKDYSDNLPQNYFYLSVKKINRGLELLQTNVDNSKSIISYISENKTHEFKTDNKIRQIVTDTITGGKYALEQKNTGYRLIKYMPNGKIEKSVEIKTNLSATCFVEQSDKDKIVIAGTYKGVLKTGDFMSNKSLGKDIFLITIDKNLNILREYVANIKSDQILGGISVSEGKIFITGQFTECFIGEIDSKGRKDVFLAKLDAESLKLEKIISFGSKYDDYGELIKIDKENNIIVGGQFSGKFNINDTIISPEGAKDIFVCKFDRDLNLLWINSFGTNGNDYLTDLSVSNRNNIYLSGTYRTQINDSVPKNTLYFNTVLAKYFEDGKQSFFYTINDSNHYYFNPQIAVDGSHIFVAGNKYNNEKKGNFLYDFFDCDFGKKINLPDTIIIDYQNKSFTAKEGFKNYIWSDGTKIETIYPVYSGKYFLTTTDSNGCISTDSAFVLLEATDIQKQTNHFSHEFDMIIYPNPAKNSIILKFKNVDVTKPVQIIVFSETGKVVLHKLYENVNDSEIKQIKFNLTNGFYTIKTINGTNIKNKKLTIQN